ncbi:hypothetical protein HQ531_06830 [bacterium]|nr:hypothetical protein [bacterium]
MQNKLLILLAFIILSTVLNASVDDIISLPKNKYDKVAWLKYYASLEKRQMLSKAAAISDRRSGIHNGNRVRTLFYNFGTIGKPGTEPSMEWPIGSGRGYAYEFGVLAGAKVKNFGGDEIKLVSDALIQSGVSYESPDNTISGNWQPIYGHHDPFSESIAMSDTPDENRDNKPDSWPLSWFNVEFGDYMWPGEYGLGVTTADQESYYVMDDYYIKNHNTYWPEQIAPSVSWTDTLNEDEFYPALGVDTVRGGLGLEVQARGYQWTATRAQNVIFFVYEVENVGTDTLNNVYFGMYGDPHIGGAGDVNDDDAYFDTFLDMVYGWDDDARGDSYFGGNSIPGFFGYKFLESPGEPRDGIDNDDDGMVDESMQDGIDNDGDWQTFTDWNLNGEWDWGEPINDDLGTDGVGPEDAQYVRPDPDGSEVNGFPDDGEPNFDEKDLDEADQIGLTGFVVGPWSSSTPTADVYYNRLSSPIQPADFTQTHDNYFLYGSGPISMSPGDVRRFSISMLFGFNITGSTGDSIHTDPYNTRDLYATAGIMQEIYDAGYRFVKPPNKPRLTAIPGDGQVTLYWDDGAEKSRDPLYGHDFEGYAIYRATDFGFNESLSITDTYGSPYLWSPIAKFDLKNTLSGPHPIEQIQNSGLHFDMGRNTGLVHSFVDKDLINGLRYFYAVCAYDSGSVNDTLPPTETSKTIQEDFTGAVLLDVNTAMVTPQAPALGYIPPEVLHIDDGTSTPGTGTIEIDIIDPTLVPDDRILEVRFLDSGMDLVDNDEDWLSFTDADLLIENSPYVDLVVPTTSDSTFYESITYDTLTLAAEIDKEFVHNGQTWKIKTWLEGPTLNKDTVVVFPATIAIGPTLDVWDYSADGSVHDDVGSDGCSDEYEYGDGSCSDTLLAASPGDDPNGDNWHPQHNPQGTEANGRADMGETNIDLSDFQELSRSTQSFSVYDVTDPADEIIIMSNQLGLNGEDFNQISNGMQLFVYNDTLLINNETSGWIQGDCIWRPNASIYDVGAYKGAPVPYDYEIEFFPTVVDTSLETTHFTTNGQKLTFQVRDVTNDKLLTVYASNDFDGIRSLVTQDITPAIYLNEEQTGTEYWEDIMFTWQFSFSTPLKEIWSIFPAENGVMIGTETSGLAIYNQESKGWIFYDEITSGGGLRSDNKIKDIIFYEGYYWIATQNGPSIYDGDVWYRNHGLETLFDEFKKDSQATLEDPDKTKSYGAVTAFDVDVFGNLWIATLDEGLVRVKTNQTYLTSADDDIVVFNDSLSESLESLNDTKLNDIYIKGNMVWLATEKGIVSYDYGSNIWHHYTKNDLGVSNDDFYAIAELSEEQNSALVFAGKSGLTFMVGDTFIVHGDSLLPNGRAYSLAQPNNNELYVGTHSGYAIIDFSNAADSLTTGLTSEKFVGSWNDSTIFSSDKIRAIAFSNDIGYFGTEEGLEQRVGEYEWNTFGPQSGDILRINTRKEFSSQDKYQFSTSAAKVDAAREANSLDKVSVVPNPYVASAIWEQKPYLRSGRGERKIYFINLPSECTIRIYTIAGELVRKLEHSSPASDPDKTLFDGAESWDLLNLDQLEVAYGVYIYHVETNYDSNNAETIGKFAVIK